MAVIKRKGPISLTNVLAANIYNPPGPEVVRNIHVCNHSDNPVTFSLWVGTTGTNEVGSELFSRQSVPARGIFDWPYPIKLGAADFVVGGADLTTSVLTIVITTEQAAV